MSSHLNSSSSSKIKLILLFFHLNSVAPLLYAGTEIRELNSNTATFITDANLWVANPPLANNFKHSLCPTTSTNYLLGGFGVLGGTIGSYFERTHTNLGPHTMIRFSINVWMIDSWDAGDDAFWLYFNGERIDGWHLNHASFPTDMCGLGIKDAPNTRIFGKVPHISSTLVFRIVSQLDTGTGDESFGIREVNFLLDKNPTSSPALCGISPMTPKTFCPTICPEKWYFDGSSCQECHAYCLNCYGPSTSECYSCVQTGGVSWDGYQCINCHSSCETCVTTQSMGCTSCVSGSTSTLYPAGGTCVNDCPYPFTIVSTGGLGYGYPNTCVNPCPEGQFVYWDRTCSATCPLPLQSKGFNTIERIAMCVFPCSPIDYLIWDGSCARDCSFPLVVSTIRNMKLCTYNCLNTEYLFPDGSCGLVCNYPLVIKEYLGKLFCISPCNVPGQYVNPNQECTFTCLPYYTTSTSAGISYCNYPCSGADFLYWDGLCLPNCVFPLQVRIQRHFKFCDNPAIATYLYWDSTSAPTCDPPLIVGLITPNNPPNLLCTYPCNQWEYLYWESTCSLDCVFPLTKRLQNGRRFCDYSCTGTDFLYWNGSCLGSCDLPLQSSSDKGKQFCNYPTNISQYLYWDGSSEPTCPLPLSARIEGSPMVRMFCDFICDDPLYPYLYWNSTCSDEPCGIPITIKGNTMCEFPCGDGYLSWERACMPHCNSPSTIRHEGIGKYCEHPCHPHNYDYYYWNGVCRGYCFTPLRQVKDENVTWCLYPCLNEQTLYTNGTCSEGCDPPFLPNIDVDTDFNFCVNPCPSSQYLAWNSTCFDFCDPPFHVKYHNMGNLCVKPCPEPYEYLDEITGQCITECGTPSLSKDGDYLICLADRNDYSNMFDFLIDTEGNYSSALSLVLLPNFLQYIKYIDIEYPYRLQKLAANHERPFYSLRYRHEMPTDLRNFFPKFPLPQIFEKYQALHSSFLVNFWKEIITWVIVIILAVLLAVLELYCKMKGFTAWQGIFHKLKMLAKWNVLVLLMGTSLSDIILYTILELRTLHLNSSLLAFSFEISMAMFFLLLALPLAVSYLVKKYERVCKYQSDVRCLEFLSQWEGYQIFFQGFRDNNCINRRFYMFYMIRLAAPSFIVSILYTTPITQIVSYLTLGLVSFIYIFIQQPLTRLLDHVQLLILEAFILVINVSLLGIHIINEWDHENYGARVMFGDLIVGLNSGIQILFLTVLVLKIGEGIRAICHLRNYRHKKNDFSLWLQLIVYCLQQGGMGFETIYIDHQFEFVMQRERLALEKERERKQSLLKEIRKKEYVRQRINKISPEVEALRKADARRKEEMRKKVEEKKKKELEEKRRKDEVMMNKRREQKARRMMSKGLTLKELEDAIEENKRDEDVPRIENSLVLGNSNFAPYSESMQHRNDETISHFFGGEGEGERGGRRRKPKRNDNLDDDDGDGDVEESQIDSFNFEEPPRKELEEVQDRKNHQLDDNLNSVEEFVPFPRMRQIDDAAAAYLAARRRAKRNDNEEEKELDE